MGHDRPAESATVQYGADLQVGAFYQLGSHTLDEQEIIDFASMWDPQDFHTDSVVARKGTYHGLIASGIHTLAIYQRLAIQAVVCHWSVIAGRSIRDLRFLRPVRPGDTLTGSLTIEAIAFDERNRALVTHPGLLRNQHGKKVLSLAIESFVWATPKK